MKQNQPKLTKEEEKLADPLFRFKNAMRTADPDTVYDLFFEQGEGAGAVRGWLKTASIHFAKRDNTPEKLTTLLMKHLKLSQPPEHHERIEDNQNRMRKAVDDLINIEGESIRILLVKSNENFIKEKQLLF